MSRPGRVQASVPWSWAGRSQEIDRVAAGSHDVIVIGGGITGAGIALEAALAGLSVVLFEQGDFAAGASSGSSKLLHGGLRYLEQGHVGLVREALAQRNRLLRHAPHVARELPFLLPVLEDQGDPLWFVDAGVWAYDALASLSELKLGRLHRRLDAAALLERVPTLRRDGLVGGLAYTDGWMEDARLVLDTLVAARHYGAVALPRIRVTGLERHASGSVAGVAVEDRLTGRSFTVRGRVVVNATGPWVDRTNGALTAGSPRMLAPTKGIHLVTRQLSDEALIFRVPVPGRPGERRVMFVIPFMGRSLLGTTDTAPRSRDASDAFLEDDVYPTAAEVRLVLAEVGRLLPGANLGPEDVLSTFGGWRPLVAPPVAGQAESRISREHVIRVDPTGLVTVAGGKYTTSLAMARQVVDRMTPLLGPALRRRRPHADEVPLGGGDIPGHDLDRYRAWVRRRHPDRDPRWLDRLVSRLGSRYREVLSLLDEDATLAGEVPGLDPLCGLTWAELAHHVRVEQALSAQDVLMRRTRIFLVDSRQGEAAIEPVARRMVSWIGEWLGWSTEERSAWYEGEVTGYRRELARSRAWRQDLERGGS
jgi:glycerol-3-phosphate dehydrogenase